jgi:hypothetical protein
MSQNQNISIVVVEKSGQLKSSLVKEFKEEDLFKKCGFKKGNDFLKHTEWKLNMNGNKYLVSLYGKTEGRANNENKYDFPPPVDSTLFFGTCALVAQIKNSSGTLVLTDLSVDLWIKMYEKLFGGFEDLAATAAADEEEEDELAHVPKEKKTKHGYLKDGFVVDSEGDEEQGEDEDDSNFEDVEEDEDEEEEDEVDDLEDIGSELSEDEYDYKSNF